MNTGVQKSNMNKQMLGFLLLSLIFTTGHAIDIDAYLFGDDTVIGQIATIIDYGDNATSGFDGAYVVGETKNASYPYQIYLKLPNNIDVTGKVFHMALEPFCDYDTNDSAVEWSAKVGIGSASNIEYVNFTNYCTKIWAGETLTWDDIPILEIELTNLSTQEPVGAFSGFNSYRLFFYKNENTRPDIRQLYQVTIDSIGMSFLDQQTINENTLETSLTRFIEINLEVWEILFTFVKIISMFYGFIILPLRFIERIVLEVKRIFKRKGGK